MKFEQNLKVLWGVEILERIETEDICLMFGKKSIFILIFENTPIDVFYRIFDYCVSKDKKYIKTVFLIKIANNSLINKKKLKTNIYEGLNLNMFIEIINEAIEPSYLNSGNIGYFGKIIGFDIRFENEILKDFNLNKEILKIHKIITNAKK